MNIKPIEKEEDKFEKVMLLNGLPHCAQHGAMNKVSSFDGGGYWRCVSAVSDQNDNICRAGCVQTN